MGGSWYTLKPNPSARFGGFSRALLSPVVTLKGSAARRTGQDPGLARCSLSLSPHQGPKDPVTGISGKVYDDWVLVLLGSCLRVMFDVSVHG